MSRRWIVAVALALMLPGTVSAAERRLSVTSFDTVRIEGDVAVEIVSDAAPGAVAIGEPRALDTLSIRIQGNALLVRRTPTNAPIEQRAKRIAPDAVPLVRISARSVESLSLRGHGSARLDRLAGSKPSARVDGDGSVEIGGVKADALSVTVTGGGSLKIAGTAASGRAMMMGDGLLEASGLTLASLDFTGEGPVRARLKVDGPARIVANGDSQIIVGGHPTCTARQTGTGLIDCGGQPIAAR